MCPLDSGVKGSPRLLYPLFLGWTPWVPSMGPYISYLYPLGSLKRAKGPY